jgi:hypothetical protein
MREISLTTNEDVVPDTVIPQGDLPPLKYRDLPEPLPLRRMIGPGIILAGLSLGSGEFVIWPFITLQSGFVFFWASLLGVSTQYLINMEITRWTLATGESAVTGFARLSRHWAWVFLVANVVPHMIPAWGTGAAQLLAWLFWPPELISGVGNVAELHLPAAYLVPWFAVAGLVFCGLLLTAGPVVYKTMERTQLILVALILMLVLVIAVLVVRPDAVAAQVRSTLTLGYPQFVPEPTGELTAALLLGALAFAGCGGMLNMGQSNYIKDKGFGMGQHIGRITSPLTGQEEAVTEVGYHFHHTAENLLRWRTWWRRAGWEHFLSFWATCVFCLSALTLISYSLFYSPDGSLHDDAHQFRQGLTFIYGQSVLLEQQIGAIGRLMFLVIGIAILFTTELAVLDTVSRISTDIVKVAWLRDNQWWTPSRLYSLFLWGEIALGVVILIASAESVSRDTLQNFKIVSSLNGGIMCVYSATLLWLNCRYLPAPLRMSWPRVIGMLWAVVFFGYFALWAGWNLWSSWFPAK